VTEIGASFSFFGKFGKKGGEQSGNSIEKYLHVHVWRRQFPTFAVAERRRRRLSRT
jgi:hypothetical protein